MNPGLIWLGIAAIFLLIQIGSPRANVICFTVGAFIAAVSTVVVYSYMMQAVIFAIVSIAAIPVVRPIADRLSRKKGVRA